MKQEHTYNAGINFLRAIAILGIVAYHIFPYTIKGGFLGVCVFFLISGYLAARQSQVNWANGDFSFKKYYLRKLKRIFPPLYVMVMSIIAFFTLFHQELLLGAREEVLSIFLGVNNWWQMATHASYFLSITEHSPFTHLWYMGVQMQMLLLWPILFWVFKKLSERKLGKYSIWYWVLLVVASAGLMAYLYRPDNVNRIYYGTDTRAFAFFMGVILGLKEDTWKEHMPAWMKGMAGRVLVSLSLTATIALFLLVNGQSSWLYRGGMVGITLFFALMIFVMNCYDFHDTYFAKSRIFSYVGKHSYLIYLWHYPIVFILMYLY